MIPTRRFAEVSATGARAELPIAEPHGFEVVPGGGIEPPQSFWPLRILSPLRLPISPSRPCL